MSEKPRPLADMPPRWPYWVIKMVFLPMRAACTAAVTPPAASPYTTTSASSALSLAVARGAALQAMMAAALILRMFMEVIEGNGGRSHHGTGHLRSASPGWIRGFTSSGRGSFQTG